MQDLRVPWAKVKEQENIKPFSFNIKSFNFFVKNTLSPDVVDQAPDFSGFSPIIS